MHRSPYFLARQLFNLFSTIFFFKIPIGLRAIILFGEKKKKKHMSAFNPIQYMCDFVIHVGIRCKLWCTFACFLTCFCNGVRAFACYVFMYYS